jgi:hypothetical protein
MDLKPKIVQMRKLLLPLVLIIPTWSATAQIQNGGFENWTKMILFEHPAMGINSMSSNYETFFNDGSLNVNRVSSPNGSALRVETKMAGEDLVPGWFITGETPDQQGEGLLFGGGFPVSDGNVSGISMNIRYNVPESSPGFVVVQFKNNGVPVGTGNMGVGTYMFPITGETDWTNMSWDFGGPLEVTPDQCVIGIVCADVLNSDQNFVEGAFIEVDNILFINSTDVMPAGNFEGWSYVEPIWTPDDAVVDVDPFHPTYERSTEANNGSFSLKLMTIQPESDWTQVGRVWIAESTDGEVVPNIMLNETHTTLTFNYKYTSVNNDVAAAQITFYQLTENGYVPVYWKNIDLNGNADWEEVEYNFSEELGQNFVTADAMSIMFESSKFMESMEPQPGSTLIIDDIALSGALPVFNPVSNTVKGSIKSWPNPTLMRVTMDLGIPRTGFYRVFNEQGMQVDIREFTGQRYIVHDLSPMPSGKYIFRFQHNGGVQITSVIKL